MKAVKLRRTKHRTNGKDYCDYSLNVPFDIAKRIEARGIDHFEVRLTDEGLLYVPIVVPVANGEEPEWLRGGGVT